MGYWAQNSAVITNVIGPGPSAVHKHTSFLPDHDWQVDKIDQIYFSSKRMHAYLGDWHSHPKGGLYLGWRDRRTLRKISNCPEARISSPVMLVAAGGDPEWNIGAWVLASKSFLWWEIGRVGLLPIITEKNCTT